MGNLTHTFQATSEVIQDATFSINLFDDALNEREEKFVAVVTVTRIQNQEEDAEEQSDRLYAIVTIRVNPRAPDGQSTYVILFPLKTVLLSPLSSLLPHSRHHTICLSTSTDWQHSHCV